MLRVPKNYRSQLPARLDGMLPFSPRFAPVPAAGSPAAITLDAPASPASAGGGGRCSERCAGCFAHPMVSSMRLNHVYALEIPKIFG